MTPVLSAHEVSQVKNLVLLNDSFLLLVHEPEHLSGFLGNFLVQADQWSAVCGEPLFESEVDSVLLIILKVSGDTSDI